MSQVTFHHGDNRDVLRRMIDQGVRVHSVVTDPPYHLESVVKRFGKPGSAPAKFGSDGAFARQSKGFMGKKWDGTDEDGSRIAQDPDFWALIHEILLPGGFVLAFSSPRTGHWQACAMETAGFVMHPFIGWAYGQGFPKAHNAARAVDQALGTQGSKLVTGGPVRRIRPGADQNREGWEKLADRVYEPGVYQPGSAEAEAWQGWSYGAQAMKPALEPIYVGQKPFSEKNGAMNLLKHGVGALNIDACRVPVTDAAYARNCSGDRGHSDNRTRKMDFALTAGSAHEGGRWPANLIHDGSDAVVEMFPESAGQQGDVRGDEPSGVTNMIYGQFQGRVPSEKRGDSGSAARFFNAFPVEDDLWAFELDGNPVVYCGKANSKDRVIKCTACGSRFIGKRPCACVGDDGRPAKTECHPTVKPNGLMRWLCRLVTPPGGVVLDPFAGSGTTGRAALDEGFRPILIERENEYAADVRHRFQLGRPLPLEILELLDGPRPTFEASDLIG